MLKDEVKGEYMDIELTISRIEFIIKPILRNDNIKAFVDIILHSNLGEIKIKNGTIRLKELENKTILTYEVPAIKGKYKYNKILFIDNKELYVQISNEIVKQYIELAGELPNNFLLTEEVDLEDLPI